MRISRTLTAAMFVALTGCMANSKLPSGDEAYRLIPARPADATTRSDYHIGPLDVLSVTVFQEPDLTFKELQVDASGNIQFPLIGSVHVGGKSTTDVSSELKASLNKSLVNPQVTVGVVSSVSQQITVEGSVTMPGVYDVAGSTSLLKALAQAKSPTRVARLDQVVVFRVVNGVRTGALFDVNKIRIGAADDPELLGGDVVVVGFSSVKGAFRDFLTTAPVLSVFRAF